MDEEVKSRGKEVMAKKMKISAETKKNTKHSILKWMLLSLLGVIISVIVVGILIIDKECRPTFCSVINDEVVVGEDEHGWVITQPETKVVCHKEKYCSIYTFGYSLKLFSWSAE